MSENIEKQINKQDNYAYEFNSLASLMGNYNSCSEFNPSTVKMWLKDPMRNNKHIRKLSRNMYSTNGIYTNVIDYMISLPTLDRILHGTSKNHKKFKKNKEKFNEALRLIKDKIIVRDNLFKNALDGTSFYYFESTEDSGIPKYLNDIDIDGLSEINSFNFNCSLLPLPTDHCRIVGRRNSSYVVAFDMSYFEQFRSNGLSLKLKRYPKEIRNGYRAYRKDVNKKWCVLDNDKTVTTKVRSKIEDPWGLPLGLSAFLDMLYEADIIESKKNALNDFNSSVYYMTFPEGEKKGQSSLTQKQQQQLHENVKTALFSNHTGSGSNFVSLASGTKLEKLKKDNIELLKDKIGEELIDKISTGLGFAGSLLNGKSGGSHASMQSNIQLISAEIFTWLEQIADELTKVINKNIIKDDNNYVQLYYLPVTHVNRKEMVQNMRDLYTHGRGSLLAWISSTGINPDAYMSLMDYEVEEDFESKYPIHQTSFTQSGKQDGSKESKEVVDTPENDNTAKNKTNGTNEYYK